MSDLARERPAPPESIRRRPVQGMTALALLFGSALLGLAGCSTVNTYSSVEQARTLLLGFSRDDVLMCAGFPNRKQVDGDNEIWSYESSENPGGASISTTPLFFGLANASINYSPGGSCKVQMRFVDGKLQRVAYAGNNDSSTGRDTMCTPVVDDCVNYAHEGYRILPPPVLPPPDTGEPPRSWKNPGPDSR